MLTPSTRLRLRAILDRIGADQPVTLQERIYVQKFADRDQGVAAWLREARQRQRQHAPQPAPARDGIDALLEQMRLGPADPESAYRPGEDDIEGWLGGAPGWLRRS
jgi:hypothetical protein